jgi:hypothetical protein
MIQHNSPGMINYLYEAQNLAKAAKQLTKERNWDLHFRFPESFWDTHHLITGELSALAAFGDNDESKEWILTLDERTGFRCTIAMFIMTVLPLFLRIDTKASRMN